MRFRRTPGDTPNPRSAGRTLRLTSKLPVILLAVLLVNQIFNPARIWVGIILGLALVLGISYLWAFLLRDGLSAQRHLRGAWVLAGDMLNETFVVENDSDMPAMWVEVIDHSELPGYHVDWVASVDARNRQSYKAEGRCQHRGVFTIGPWELRTGDPLGLFRVTDRVSGDAFDPGLPACDGSSGPAPTARRCARRSAHQPPHLAHHDHSGGRPALRARRPAALDPLAPNRAPGRVHGQGVRHRALRRPVDRA